MTVEFLTGSIEFFPHVRHKDTDYVCFREQGPVFEYERSHRFGFGTTGERWDRFCYRKGLTKAEYFHWHRTENEWSLNFAPLITKGFLEYLGIDIHGADYDDVYWIMRHAFGFDYHLPHEARYQKWFYRLYIYTCFIRNRDLTLTERQLSDAYDLYRQIYPDINVVHSIYEFFEHDHELTRTGLQTVFGEEALWLMSRKSALPTT